jgi:hypothetical protein
MRLLLTIKNSHLFGEFGNLHACASDFMTIIIIIIKMIGGKAL